MKIHISVVNTVPTDGLAPLGARPSADAVMTKCTSCMDVGWPLNKLRPRQNGHHSADDIFKGIFLNWNVLILIKISLKFVPKCPINNIAALVQIMAWCWPGEKPLFKPMLTHLTDAYICGTRERWVKPIYSFSSNYWELKRYWTNSWLTSEIRYLTSHDIAWSLP